MALQPSVLALRAMEKAVLAGTTAARRDAYLEAMRLACPIATARCLLEGWAVDKDEERGVRMLLDFIAADPEARELTAASSEDAQVSEEPSAAATSAVAAAVAARQQQQQQQQGQGRADARTAPVREGRPRCRPGDDGEEEDEEVDEEEDGDEEDEGELPVSVQLRPYAGHAFYELGYCFDKGFGVPRIASRAVEYYSLAVSHYGNVYAAFNLGLCYYFGQGVEQNVRRAVELYAECVAAGHVRAMANLGVCLLNGSPEVEKDTGTAVYLFSEASAAGHVGASYHLGLCLEKGLGVEPDLEMAVSLYMVAAQHNNRNATEKLGLMYREGLGGLPKDLERSADLLLDSSSVELVRLPVDVRTAAAVRKRQGTCWHPRLLPEQLDEDGVKRLLLMRRRLGRCRVFFLGEEGAGKSSTLRSIIGENFEQNTSSTDRTTISVSAMESTQSSPQKPWPAAKGDTGVYKQFRSGIRESYLEHVQNGDTGVARPVIEAENGFFVQTTPNRSETSRDASASASTAAAATAVPSSGSMQTVSGGEPTATGPTATPDASQSTAVGTSSSAVSGGAVRGSAPTVSALEFEDDLSSTLNDAQDVEEDTDTFFREGGISKEVARSISSLSAMSFLHRPTSSSRKTRIEFWDMAGQRDYYALHNLFLGKERCVYLVVFDLSNGGSGRSGSMDGSPTSPTSSSTPTPPPSAPGVCSEDPVGSVAGFSMSDSMAASSMRTMQSETSTGGGASTKGFERIMFWLKSIYLLGEEALQNTLLVGTHAAKLSDEELETAMSDIKRHLMHTPFRDVQMVAIDNKKGGTRRRRMFRLRRPRDREPWISSIVLLREAIAELANPIADELVPLYQFKLQSDMEQFAKSRGQFWLKLNEAYSLSQFNRPTTDALLASLAKSGAILHYPSDETTRETIVVSTLDFAHTVCTRTMVPPPDMHALDTDTFSKWEKLVKKGKLDVQLIHDLLRSTGSKMDGRMALDLMTNLNLCFPDRNNPEEYFVPASVMYLSRDPALARLPESTLTDREVRTLYVQWTHRYDDLGASLPEPLFHYFVVRLATSNEYSVGRSSYDYANMYGDETVPPTTPHNEDDLRTRTEVAGTSSSSAPIEQAQRKSNMITNLDHYFKSIGHVASTAQQVESMPVGDSTGSESPGTFENNGVPNTSHTVYGCQLASRSARLTLSTSRELDVEYEPNGDSTIRLTFRADTTAEVRSMIEWVNAALGHVCRHRAPMLRFKIGVLCPLVTELPFHIIPIEEVAPRQLAKFTYLCRGCHGSKEGHHVRISGWTMFAPSMADGVLARRNNWLQAHHVTGVVLAPVLRDVAEAWFMDLYLRINQGTFEAPKWWGEYAGERPPLCTDRSRCCEAKHDLYAFNACPPLQTRVSPPTRTKMNNKARPKNKVTALGGKSKLMRDQDLFDDPDETSGADADAAELCLCHKGRHRGGRGERAGANGCERPASHGVNETTSNLCTPNQCVHLFPCLHNQSLLADLHVGGRKGLMRGWQNCKHSLLHTHHASALSFEELQRRAWNLAKYFAGDMGQNTSANSKDAIAWDSVVKMLMFCRAFPLASDDNLEKLRELRNGALGHAKGLLEVTREKRDRIIDIVEATLKMVREKVAEYGVHVMPLQDLCDKQLGNLLDIRHGRMQPKITQEVSIETRRVMDEDPNTTIALRVLAAHDNSGESPPRSDDADDVEVRSTNSSVVSNSALRSGSGSEASSLTSRTTVRSNSAGSGSSAARRGQRARRRPRWRRLGSKLNDRAGGIADWTPTDVRQWIESFESFRAYGELFSKEEITGLILSELTKDDLREIGIATVGARRTLLMHIQQLVSSDEMSR